MDWENEWKNYFYLFWVLKKFIIVFSWEIYVKEVDEEFCIEFDLGMVFGIGDYLIISMCLKVIEIYVLL